MTDDNTARALAEFYLRQFEMEAEGRRVLEEAKKVYAPAEAPAELPTDGPQTGSGRKRERTPFDRYLTVPVWWVYVGFLHLMVVALSVGAVTAAASMLMLTAAFFDALGGRAFGLAITVSAAGLWGLSALGICVLTLKSFLERAGECPW